MSVDPVIAIRPAESVIPAMTDLASSGLSDAMEVDTPECSSICQWHAYPLMCIDCIANVSPHHHLSPSSDAFQQNTLRVLAAPSPLLLPDVPSSAAFTGGIPDDPFEGGSDWSYSGTLSTIDSLNASGDIDFDSPSSGSVSALAEQVADEDGFVVPNIGRDGECIESGARDEDVSEGGVDEQLGGEFDVVSEEDFADITNGWEFL